MVDNNAAYWYDIPNKGPFVIMKCWTNEMVTLQCSATKMMYNTRHIKPYTSDTNVEDIKILELMIANVTFAKVPVTYFCMYIKAQNKVL